MLRNNNSNFNEKITVPTDESWQQFVSRVRSENSSVGLLTVDELRKQVKDIETTQSSSTDRIVGALNQNKATDEIIGTNRQILGIDTKIAHYNRDQIDNLDFIGRAVAKGNKNLFLTMRDTALSFVPVANWFGAARQRRIQRMTAKSEFEARKLMLKTSLNQDKYLSDTPNLLKSIAMNVALMTKEWMGENKFSEVEKSREAEIQQKGLTGLLKKMFTKKEKEITVDPNILLMGRKRSFLGTALLGLGFIVALVWNRFKMAAKYISVVVKVLKSVFNFVKGLDISAVLKGRSRGTIKIIDTIFDIIKSPITRIAEIFGKTSGFVSKITKFIRPALKIFEPILGILKTIGGPLIRIVKIGGKAVPVLNVILGLFETVLGAFRGMGLADEAGVSKLTGGFVGAIGGVLEFFTFGLLDFKAFFADIAPKFQKIIDAFKGGNFAEGVGRIIKFVVWDLNKWIIKTIVDSAVSFFKYLRDDLFTKENLKSFGAFIKKFMYDAAEGLGSWILGLVGLNENDPVTRKIIDVIMYIPNKLLDFFTLIKDSVFGLFEKISSTFKILSNISLNDIKKYLLARVGIGKYDLSDLFDDAFTRINNAENAKITQTQSKDDYNVLASKMAIASMRQDDALLSAAAIKTLTNNGNKTPMFINQTTNNGNTTQLLSPMPVKNINRMYRDEQSCIR